jgi:hypothetical protein
MGESRNRPVVVLDGNDLVVELTATHLQHILMGRVSVPRSCGDLEQVAIAHAYFKAVGRDSADQFVCKRFVYDKSVGGDQVAVFCVDILVGPTTRLQRSHIRTMNLKQTVTTPTGLSIPFFITAVYDQRSVAFVGPDGNCLYVKREQLLNSQTLPNLDLCSGSGEDDGGGGGAGYNVPAAELRRPEGDYGGIKYCAAQPQQLPQEAQETRV